MRLRWTVMVLVALVTFALMYGADYAFGRSFTLKPLEESFLAHSGVKNIQVITPRKPLVVQVELHDDIDLRRTVEELEQILAKTAGDQSSLRVLENEIPELDNVYQQIHLSVFEAIKTGKFTLLENRIQNLELGSDIKVSVQVTLQRVYITISSNAGTLYKIINY